MRVLPLAFTSLFLLGGCATLSEKDCQGMNWGQRGFDTAMRGEKLEGQVNKDLAACEKHKIPVDRNEFASGYKAGLKSFCSPENGFAFGKAGKNYDRTCASENEDAFLRNYQTGFMQYSVRRIAELEDEVRRLRGELSERDHQIQIYRSK